MGATYVIGDIHGCFDTLQALWPKLGFDFEDDRLWLVGDLVNRGPRSLDVLRWAMDLEQRLGSRMQVVLGNHDLHLLALHDGYGSRRRKDTVDDVLAAGDRDRLIAWLARRRLFYRDGDLVMVHAGLLPQWTPEDAEELAREIEPVLTDPKRRRWLLDRFRKPSPDSRWHGPRAALSALVGLRTCTVDGEPCGWKGPPDDAPQGCLPWFDVPGRASADVTVIFGHWAAMKLHLSPSAIGLDDGCVWGHRLTAIRLPDRALFHQPTLDVDLPRKHR